MNNILLAQRALKVDPPVHVDHIREKHSLSTPNTSLKNTFQRHPKV